MKKIPIELLLLARRLRSRLRRAEAVALAVITATAVFAAYVVVPAFWTPQSRAYGAWFGYPALMRVLDQAIVVNAEPVQERPMLRVIAAEGALAYLNEVPVHSEVPGIVTQVLAEPGTRARIGGPLLYLNPGVHTANLFDLREQLSKVERDQARLVLERERRLHDHNFTSKARLDAAEANMRRAETASDLAVEEYAQQLRSRSSTVAGDPLPIPALRVSKQRVAIAATIDGTVIERNVQLGENLIDLKKPLLVIGDRLVFRAFVDQRYAGLVREGDEGRFYLRARPGHEVRAKVVRVSHEVQAHVPPDRRRIAEPPPFTFSVWLSIPASLAHDAALLPGMNGYALFQRRYTAAALPERALMRYSGRTGTVLAVDASNRIRVEPVSFTGAQDGWVALEGSTLRPGDFVVVSGQTALQAGDKVAVRPPALHGSERTAKAR